MKSLTTLVGTTASNNTTLYPLSFTALAQNNSAANVALGTQLVNDQHRYLLLKYFSNESSYSITTLGANQITLTAIPAIGAISATLSFAWAYLSTVTQVTFSDGEIRDVTFLNGSTAISWSNGLVGTKFTLTGSVAAAATTATLQTAWAYPTAAYVVQFSSGEQKTVTITNGTTALSWIGGLTTAAQAFMNTSINTTTIGVGGSQFYKLPPDYSKLKTGTLTIGNLKWTPTEILTREEWDRLNVFPYYSDIPNNFFIWKNQFGIWPIPSTTGNTISFNYKRRIPDLSLADYTTGTVTVAVGGTTVTGSGTTWIPTVSTNNESRWIQFAQPTGDNLWYQIQSVDSTTSLTLYDPYYGTTAIAGGAYTIGQMPILLEDFQDLLVYGALMVYFSSVVDNDKKFKKFKATYDEKIALLNEYAGQKTIHVNLGRQANYANPNLFWQGGNASS